MNAGLLRAITDIGIEFHPDRINAIAKNIACISSVCDFSKVRVSLGQIANNPLLVNLENEWQNNPGFSPKEIAAALRGASEATAVIEKCSTVEMVWTGPFTGLVPSRHTEQVLLELIANAKLRLFIVSFVAYDFEPIKRALLNAVKRNVSINILLESSKYYGGQIDIDAIGAFKKMVPLANIYAWDSKSKSIEFNNGAVHSKCAVADGSVAFITSANLTRSAMENNMELGVLVHGGNLPVQLEKHLEALIVTEVIEQI